MARRSVWLTGTVSGVGLAGLLALFALVPSSPSRAQTPAQTPAATPPTSTALPEGYVGAETCKGCHEEAYNKFEKTRMGRLFLKQPRTEQERIGCENCHGPGQAHVDAGGGKGQGGLITFAKKDPTPVEKRNQVCLTCHTKGGRLFWDGSAHEAASVACTSCHRVMEEHSPRNNLAQETVLETCGTCHLKQRAQQFRNAHMPLREGKMTCTSCHNPHGSVTPALLRESSVNDNCFRCHTEKRGPFLWQHQPQIESCAICHDPHGTNHESMLKIAKPRLCQQCHIETRHPTSPYGLDTSSFKFVRGRACVSCHVNIHGSNHPQGFVFTR